ANTIATVAAALKLLLSLSGRTKRSRRNHASGLVEWRNRMLETIAIILIVLWLLGVVSGYTLGNFIYVLLVIAIVLFLVRLVSGRRVVYHIEISYCRFQIADFSMLIFYCSVSNSRLQRPCNTDHN